MEVSRAQGHIFLRIAGEQLRRRLPDPPTTEPKFGGRYAISDRKRPETQRAPGTDRLVAEWHKVGRQSGWSGGDASGFVERGDLSERELVTLQVLLWLQDMGGRVYGQVFETVYIRGEKPPAGSVYGDMLNQVAYMASCWQWDDDVKRVLAEVRAEEKLAKLHRKREQQAAADKRHAAKSKAAA
jgi:hypothetical protein